MTVLEYFDYEAQLLDDLQSVKTIHARNAIQSELVKILKDHKQFVYNTIKQFEDRIRENAQTAGQIMQGQTPDYVKKMMAEFGFHELEECDDTVGNYKFSDTQTKKLTPKRIKQLCVDVSTDSAENADDGKQAVDDQKQAAETSSASVEDRPFTGKRQKIASRKKSKKAQA